MKNLVVIFIVLCVYQARMVSGKPTLQYERSQNPDISSKTQEASESGMSSPVVAVSRQLFGLTKRCSTKRCLDKREENPKLNEMAKHLRSVEQNYQEQDPQLRPPCFKGRCPSRDSAEENLGQRFMESLDFKLPRIQRALRPPCFKGRCRQRQLIREASKQMTYDSDILQKTDFNMEYLPQQRITTIRTENGQIYILFCVTLLQMLSFMQLLRDVVLVGEQ